MHYLYDDMVDGKISRQFYEQKLQKYEEQLNAVLEAKEKHVKADVDYLKLGANIFELSQRGGELFEKRMSQNEKRELVSLVFSNLKLNGEKLDIAFHNGFEVIASRAKTQNWLPD
jgi:site-specific DNA recombinase